MKYINSGLLKEVIDKKIEIEDNQIPKIENFFDKRETKSMNLDNLELFSYQGKIIDNQLLMIVQDGRYAFAYINNVRKRCDQIEQLTLKEAELIKQSLKFDNYIANSLISKINKDLVKSYIIYHNILLNSIIKGEEMTLTLKDFVGAKTYNMFIKSEKNNKSR